MTLVLNNKNYLNYDLFLLYHTTSLIDARDLYVKLNELYLLKTYFNENDNNYLNLMNTDDSQHLKYYQLIHQSHIVVVFITKNFIFNQNCTHLFKYLFDIKKPVLILMLETIDMNDLLVKINVDNTNANYQPSDLNIIDFYASFKLNYQRWSGEAFNNFKLLLNQLLSESNSFICKK